MSQTSVIRGHLGNQWEEITINWLSKADGSYTEVVPVNGYVVQAEFVPSGTNAPSDNYGVTLLDAYGFDVLCGVGASQSTNTVKRKTPGVTISDGTNNATVPPLASGNHTLTIASAGAGKQGAVVLLVK